MCVDPDLTLVVLKRNPRCISLRVVDINPASGQPQACVHVNIILRVSVAVPRSDQLSSCPLYVFLFNFDLPIPTVG